jgi:hypothetical protein
VRPCSGLHPTFVLTRTKLIEKTKKVEMLKLRKSLALDSSFSRPVDVLESNSFFDD